jgi:hypothetical protein
MLIDERRPGMPTAHVMSFLDFKLGPARRVMAGVGHEELCGKLGDDGVR